MDSAQVLPSQQEWFSLDTILFPPVLMDDTGLGGPLPAGLGSLPLYPLYDGFYSVLGPSLSYTTQGEDQANRSTNDTINHDNCNTSATLRLPRDKVFCALSKCSGSSEAARTVAPVTPTNAMHLIVPSKTCSRPNRHSTDTMKSYTLPNGLIVRFLDVRRSAKRGFGGVAVWLLI
ncbi:hypothetical protein HOY80DRAFT_1135611 [Tuber brumale]|nr:hypothetical protein HOY80DRAFT_1135611 [Tuber brumale]